MKIIKVFFFFLIVVSSFSTKCYANAFSTEANFIFRNNVEISRIDSFLFKENYMLQEKEFVAHSLIKYKSKEAIQLLKKMLSDPKPTFQSISIMPLINAGEFEIAFNKFKELIKKNKKEVLFNFYKPNKGGEFEEKKKLIYKKYEVHFIPFLIKLCNDSLVSYSIKYNAAITLFYLGNENFLQPICNEILSNIPDPENSKKKHSEFTAEESQNWHLRYKAKSYLKRLSNEKE